jgi:hypothetical protein
LFFPPSHFLFRFFFMCMSELESERAATEKQLTLFCNFAVEVCTFKLR